MRSFVDGMGVSRAKAIQGLCPSALGSALPFLRVDLLYYLPFHVPPIRAVLRKANDDIISDVYRHDWTWFHDHV